MEVDKLYGLVGYPLSHSFSKKYFSEKFKRENISDVEYRNFEMEDIKRIINLVAEHDNLQGFNVTIPYKESIIPYLDELDIDAKEIGAVNTVHVTKKDRKPWLKGYNTDFYGFKESLLSYLTGKEKRALIFGNGGAAKAVVQTMKHLQIDYLIISRSSVVSSNRIITYKELSTNFVKEADLLINTTPLGMWPNVSQTLEIPYQAIKNGAIAYDLIYNPEETSFMKRAQQYGACVVNGLKMLELQAERAWELFSSGD